MKSALFLYLHLRVGNDLRQQPSGVGQTRGALAPYECYTLFVTPWPRMLYCKIDLVAAVISRICLMLRKYVLVTVHVLRSADEGTFTMLQI